MPYLTESSHLWVYLLRHRNLKKRIPSKAPILFCNLRGLLHVSSYLPFFLFYYLGLLAIILSSAFLTDGVGCRTWTSWKVMD